jgi:antitoxin CcdA
MRMTKHFGDSAHTFRRDEASAKPPRKRATNVSIDEEILAEAKKLGINLSQTLETELRERVRQAKIDRWSEENKKAIDSYNRFIAENGIWSEEYRKW